MHTILYPYTAERRDVLGNTSPEAQEISRGRGFCTPRPERLPEGEARGQSRGPRGAKSPPEGNLEGRGGCISQYIPTRGSVRTFSPSRQGGIRFITVRLHCFVVFLGVEGVLGLVGSVGVLSVVDVLDVIGMLGLMCGIGVGGGLGFMGVNILVGFLSLVGLMGFVCLWGSED